MQLTPEFFEYLNKYTKYMNKISQKQVLAADTNWKLKKIYTFTQTENKICRRTLPSTFRG